MQQAKCIVCNTNAVYQVTNLINKLFACPCCGQYEAVDQDVLIDGIPEGAAHLLSAFLRDHWERTRKPYRYSDRQGGKLPREFVELPIPEKIDRALLYVADRSPSLGSIVATMVEHDWPLVQAHGPAEFKHFLDHLVEANTLRNANAGAHVKGEQWQYAMTVEGWKRVAILRPIGGVRGRQAFVAMWLDKSLDGPYENGIRPALVACGYHPWRADRELIQEKICDRIVVEIRRSRILVADCTGHRTNVYYEAGLAQGIGLPLIWTCGDTDFDRLQFDTRQYTHIKWCAAEDLRQQLEDRIRALKLEPR